MTGKNGIAGKVLAVVVALAMLLTIVTIPAAAKSKLKLSKKKLTLTSGKSVTLKVKGTKKKAKWYVSGRKLVTIKTKGKKKLKAVIKAKKKAGRCYIKVKVGKKTLKCKVIVKAKKKTVAPEKFKEKKLSGTSKDRTAEFTARTVSGKETDAVFRKAMTGASLDLLKYLTADEKNKGRNILISPDSILTAMAMVENGASGNTLTQMETAFGGVQLDDFNAYLYTLNKRLTKSKNVKYHLADSIWYKEKEILVKDEFLRKNVDYFGAQIFEAPFSDYTLSDINNWVYNNTRGMIPSLLKKLDSDTVMLLINAISFESQWQDKYHDSVKKPFKCENGTVQTANMLQGTEDTYVTIGGADGFIKPYAGNKIAFLGLETPKNKTVDEFLQSLTADDFVNGYNGKETGKYSVKTKMPEFKYDYDTSLVDSLKSIGITDAFDQNTADFSGIAELNPNENLFISDVIHKTHIELNKDGTKAAAVTGVIVDKSSAIYPSKPEITVNLDHPFVYAIIDTESGIPLFIGTVKTLR